MLYTRKRILHKEEFDKINSQAPEQVLSLPPPTNLRREPFVFSSFQSDTYTKFIAAFEEELNKAFEQMHFWKCFSAFDPRGLPENSEIAGYGNGELQILIIHYGKTKEDTMHTVARLTLKCNHIRKMRRKRKKKL